MLGGVVALCAALSVASVASAIDGTQTIAIKLANTKAGTKAKPKSVGSLKVTTATTLGTALAGSFTVTKAVLFFDKNLVFNASAFKACSTSDVQTIDDKRGPVEGAGRLGHRVRPSVGHSDAASRHTNEALLVKAFNGPKSGSGYRFYLHVTGDDPLVIDTVISAKLTKATGDYGWNLTVPIPLELQKPSDVQATLTSFITTVKGTSKGTPYVGIKGCSGGKL